jgi:phage terminase small subunit
MPRRRTNTASKALRGVTQGIDAGRSPESPVRAPDATPVRPAMLDGRAAEIWDAYAPGLALQGMLTARDAHTFSVWCQLAAKIEGGELTAALVSQFRLLANDFGLTPSGKGRELAAPPAPTRSPAAHKFFDD